MIFKKSLIGNSRAALAQFNELEMTRRMYAMNEQQFINNGLCVNEGLVPRDVYQEFDNAAVEVMHSDDGDTYLNDLLPLSKSISLGKLVQKYRKVSDSGVVQTSMSGQTGVKNDQTENVYDGAIVPIHDAGFSRNFREMLAQSSEGFDSLIDDQRETVRSVRKHLADQFLDGHVDKSGNAIVIDGLSWGGMRNDSHVAQATLVFDFTDAAQTGEDIKAAFIAEIRNVMWIDNNCGKDLTYYVSRQIASVWEKRFKSDAGEKTVEQEMAGLMGVATVKVTSKLIGNQIMGFPLDSSVIQPLVGMGISTVAMPRPVYNSNHEFVTWGAIGFQVRDDYYGKTCAIYASQIRGNLWQM